MRKYFKYIFLLFIIFFVNNVSATPVNDSFLDDNLYKCIIDAYNITKGESKDYSYNILPEELLEIKTLDCSKYKGTIDDLTGLNKLTGLTSLNLSGNTFLGGSLKLTNSAQSLRSNIKLPSSLSITNKTYSIADKKVVKIDGDKVYPLSEGTTYVTMTGKVSGNNITEKYLISVSGGTVKKSNNTKLSSLYLSKGEFKFDSDVKKYSAIVDNSVSSVKVNATVLDKKSKFVNGFGPRTVELKEGTNEILVKVEAEDGSVGTYIISVIRSDGNDRNNLLANIELSVGKIDFKSDVYNYNFSVASNVDEIDVKGVSESPLAKVAVTDISGKTSDDKITSRLKVGANKITIVVTSESGNPGVYNLIVNREDYDSTDNYLQTLLIKDYDIGFAKDKYKYDLNIKNEKSLSITPSTEKASATYKIVGNENLKDGDKILIQVSDSEGSMRTYTITIHKKDSLVNTDFINNLPIKWIILIIEFVVIFVLIIVLISRMSNRPRKPKRKEKRNVSPPRGHTLGNSNSIVCRNCNTVNDIKSKTCYVCGNELK